MFVKMQNGFIVNLKYVNIIMVYEDKLDDNIVKIKFGVDEENGKFGYFENIYPTIKRAEEVYQKLQDFMNYELPTIEYYCSSGVVIKDIIPFNNKEEVEIHFNENAIFKMPKE